MSRIPFTVSQIARAIWAYVGGAAGTVADRAVNTTFWNGAAVTAPNTAGTPVVDVTRWNGTAVTAPNTAGTPVVDVTRWNGTTVTAPNTAGTPVVDATRWLGTTVATPNTAGIPSVSPIKSLTYYQGSITCAPSFSGTKDVTLSPTVNTARTIVLPMKTIGSNAGTLIIARTTSVNLSYDYISVPSASAVRFNTVVNADGANPYDIVYAFIVLEFF